MKTVFKVAVVLVVAVVVGAIVVLHSIDFDQYRGLIAEEVEAATGRKLVIQGHIQPDILSLTPSLVVNDVALANASWGTRPEMVTLERLEAEVALIPLFSGDVEVKRLVLVAPDIFLETDAEGNGNWVFEDVGRTPASETPAGAEAGAPTLPAVTEVRIEDAVLTYHDGRTGKDTSVTIDRLSGFAEDARSPLKLDLSGTYNGAPFEAVVELGALAGLADPEKPYPVDLEVKAGGATITVKGAIGEPLEAKGLVLDIAVQGADLAALGQFAGAALPEAGPYSVSAHLSDEGEAIRIAELKVALGQSDLAGDITLVQGVKPLVRGELSSKLIALNDFVGKAETQGEPAPEESAAGQEAAETDDGRIFSDEPLPLELLMAVDVEVKIAVARIVTEGPEISNVALNVALKGGKLTVKPFTAEIAKGRLSADIAVDASASPPRMTAKVTVKDIDLAAVAKEAALEEKISGKATLEASVAGKGRSMRALMAGLGGRTELVVGESRLGNAYLKFVLADVTKAVLGDVGEDTRVNCVVSRFDIDQGLAVSKAMVMDTETLTLTGEGEINLATEELDLTLTPKPKQVSLVNLAVPVNVTGRLSSPTVLPDPAGVATKVATGIIGTMTGAGLVAGLLGGAAAGSVGGEDNPCLALLSGGGAPQASADGGTASKSTEAPGDEEGRGPAGVLIEGIGDGLKSIGSQLKGLFE